MTSNITPGSALNLFLPGSTYAPCADAGTLPHSVKVWEPPQLFAQVMTPYREGYEQSQSSPRPSSCAVTWRTAVP
jgi:hypothetical protein